APVADEAGLEPGLRLLIGCWRSCLGYQGALTPESDFFLVSGSSLSAVRLAGQIETQFGIGFGPVDVFRNPTIASQWALIRARQATPEGVATLPAGEVKSEFSRFLDSLPAEVATVGPLSAQEARLYAQYRLYPDSLAYLLEMDFPLPAGIGAEAVAAA
ncbi:acyl carrier protein, partial [Parachitinimonas caeni]